MDTCIKAGSYCPVCKGVVGRDCWHDASEFKRGANYAEEFFAAKDEIESLRQQLASAQEELHFQACLTRDLLPYQERAIKSEQQLAEAKKDAERYRWLKTSDCLSYVSDTGPRPSTAKQRLEYALKMHGKQTSDMIEIRLLCYHLGPYDEPIWVNGEHFDYEANMDAAIDKAMKGK